MEHMMLWPMRAHNPNGTSISSAVFAQMTAECPYTLQWFACFPALKIAPCYVGIWTSCNTWFIWPARVRNANGNLIVSAVFAGLTSVTGICTFKTFNNISRLKSNILCQSVALQSAII